MESMLLLGIIVGAALRGRPSRDISTTGRPYKYATTGKWWR